MYSRLLFPFNQNSRSVEGARFMPIWRSAIAKPGSLLNLRCKGTYTHLIASTLHRVYRTRPDLPGSARYQVKQILRHAKGSSGRKRYISGRGEMQQGFGSLPIYWLIRNTVGRSIELSVGKCCDTDDPAIPALNPIL